jgi:hypothetical protein
MLEGKCKADFENWFEIREEIDVENFAFGIGFYKFDMAFQFGVYVDWLDSVGVDIDEIFKGELYFFDNHYQNGENHRRLAQTAAIKQANEIYNQRFKDDKFLAC